MLNRFLKRFNKILGLDEIATETESQESSALLQTARPQKKRVATYTKTREKLFVPLSVAAPELLVEEDKKLLRDLNLIIAHVNDLAYKKIERMLEQVVDPEDPNAEKKTIKQHAEKKTVKQHLEQIIKNKKIKTYEEMVAFKLLGKRSLAAQQVKKRQDTVDIFTAVLEVDTDQLRIVNIFNQIRDQQAKLEGNMDSYAAQLEIFEQFRETMAYIQDFAHLPASELATLSLLTDTIIQMSSQFQVTSLELKAQIDRLVIKLKEKREIIAETMRFHRYVYENTGSADNDILLYAKRLLNSTINRVVTPDQSDSYVDRSYTDSIQSPFNDKEKIRVDEHFAAYIKSVEDGKDFVEKPGYDYLSWVRWLSPTKVLNASTSALSAIYTAVSAPIQTTTNVVNGARNAAAAAYNYTTVAATSTVETLTGWTSKASEPLLNAYTYYFPETVAINQDINGEALLSEMSAKPGDSGDYYGTVDDEIAQIVGDVNERLEKIEQANDTDPQTPVGSSIESTRLEGKKEVFENENEGEVGVEVIGGLAFQVVGNSNPNASQSNLPNDEQGHGDDIKQKTQPSSNYNFFNAFSRLSWSSDAGDASPSNTPKVNDSKSASRDLVSGGTKTANPLTIESKPQSIDSQSVKSEKPEVIEEEEGALSSSLINKEPAKQAEKQEFYPIIDPSCRVHLIFSKPKTPQKSINISETYLAKWIEELRQSIDQLEIEKGKLTSRFNIIHYFERNRKQTKIVALTRIRSTMLEQQGNHTYDHATIKTLASQALSCATTTFGFLSPSRTKEILKAIASGVVMPSTLSWNVKEAKKVTENGRKNAQIEKPKGLQIQSVNDFGTKHPTRFF